MKQKSEQQRHPLLLSHAAGLLEGLVVAAASETLKAGNVAADPFTRYEISQSANDEKVVQPS